MRYWILIVLLLSPVLASAENTAGTQVDMPDKGVLIRDIRMDGFVLGDKDRFVKLFKPYRNKYLTKSAMDEILNKIEIIYEREGYKELVTITYQVVHKHRLIFTALMTS